jgi:hypothetical protein
VKPININQLKQNGFIVIERYGGVLNEYHAKWSAVIRWILITFSNATASVANYTKSICSNLEMVQCPIAWNRVHSVRPWELRFYRFPCILV